MSDEQKIEGEVLIQLWGDKFHQNQILQIVANALDQEIHIQEDRPYANRKGQTGHTVKFKLLFPSDQ